MRILKIEIANYKKIKVFEQELNGKNMKISGLAGSGKTTAISSLWDIIEKVGDPLKHGTEKGKIRIVLGDENKKVFAERKFTDKTNQVIIMTSEGDKISVGVFKSWFNSLGVNPHKIMEMRPLEQTEVLLNCVKLPDGIDLRKLDENRIELQDKRLVAHQDMDRMKKRIEDAPEEVEVVNVSELIVQLDKIKKDNADIEHLKFEDVRISANVTGIKEDIKGLEKLMDQKKEALKISEAEHKKVKDQLYKVAGNTKDTSNLEKKIKIAEAMNDKVFQYKQYLKDKEEFDTCESEYKKLDAQVKDIDKKKKDAMDEAEFPINGVSINEGNVIFNKCLLSNCGHSEQMLVCGALAASQIADSKLKVVRMDGIESMSKEDFKRLETIFNKKGIQVLSSRVSGGEKEENEIVIVDGVIDKK